MQGVDFSELILNPDQQSGWQDFTVVKSSNKSAKWIAAVTSRYKLVFSENDPPWLLDLEANPEETVNYIDHAESKKVIRDLANKLKHYSEARQEPFLLNSKMGTEMVQLCEY